MQIGGVRSQLPFSLCWQGIFPDLHVRGGMVSMRGSSPSAVRRLQSAPGLSKPRTTEEQQDAGY
jgi:hypothetical protein